MALEIVIPSPGLYTTSTGASTIKGIHLFVMVSARDLELRSKHSFEPTPNKLFVEQAEAFAVAIYTDTVFQLRCIEELTQSGW